MISSKVNLVRYWPWRRTWPCNSFWFKDSFEIRTGICSDSSMVHFKDWGRSNDGKPISFCQNSYKIFNLLYHLFAFSIIAYINSPFFHRMVHISMKGSKIMQFWKQAGKFIFLVWYVLVWIHQLMEGCHLTFLFFIYQEAISHHRLSQPFQREITFQDIFIFSTQVIKSKKRAISKVTTPDFFLGYIEFNEPWSNKNLRIVE